MKNTETYLLKFRNKEQKKKIKQLSTKIDKSMKDFIIESLEEMHPIIKTNEKK